MFLFFKQKHEVRYVKNIDPKYKTEKAEYLLVKGNKLPPLLFTSAEVERARKRAEKNPEDTQ